MGQPEQRFKGRLRLLAALLSLQNWVYLLGGAATIATLLGFAGQVWWGFVLLDHFRFQYSLVLLIALLLGGLSRRSWLVKRWSLLWALPLALNLSLLLPFFVAPAPSVSPGATSTLCVLHATLDHDNPGMIPQTIQYVDQQDADIVFLLEVTPETLVPLQQGLKHYRLVAAEPRQNSHGSAWFVPVQPSRPITVKGTEIIHLPAYNPRPILQATIDDAGREVILQCFHASRPSYARAVAFQQIELDALAEWSRVRLHNGNAHLIAIGDFNSTPWSAGFRAMLDRSGLVNSLQGFGLQPTWSTAVPSLLRIAIDHCLHSRSFTAVRRVVGPNIGSDHLPLLVELQWTV